MPKGLFYIVLLVYLSVGIYGLLSVPLDGEEPRRAYLAVESLFHQDPLVMRHYGQLYYNKPPLHNLLNSISINLMGAHLWSYRIVSFCAYLLTGFMLVQLLMTHNKTWALSSLFIYMLSPDLMFYQFMYSGEIDGLFSLLLFGQFICFFYYMKRLNIFFLMLAYVLGALAFLTKGIPALLITAVGQITIWFLVNNQLGKSLKHTILAVFPAIGLVAMYFWYYNIQTSNLDVYLVNLVKQSTSRAPDSAQWVSLITHILVDFPIQVIKYTFPWILLSIPILLSKKVRKSLDLGRSLIFFSFLYILLNIWPYWLSSQSKSRYLLPFIPVFAIILGYLFYRANELVHLKKYQAQILHYFALSIHLVPFLLIMVFIPSMPVYQSTTFFIVTILCYLTLIAFCKLFLKDRGRFSKGMASYALALVVIKGLLIYGVLSEPKNRERTTRNIAAHIAHLCMGKNVYMTGSEEYEKLVLDIGPIYLEKQKPKSALMAYQIPLYYYELSGRLFKYKPLIDDNACYIMKSKEHVTKQEEEYHFTDPWTHSKFSVIIP